MVAEITGINLDAERKGYKGVEFTYQPPAYEGRTKDPVTRFVFDNSDHAKVVKGLTIGSWVEMTFDDTRYKNLETLCVAVKPSGNASPRSQSGSSNSTSNSPKGGGNSGYGDADTQGRISRSVAIKEGVSLVQAMAANGGFTAANMKKIDFLAEQAVVAAKRFDAYVSNTEESGEVQGGDDAPFEEVDQDELG